MTTNTNLAPMKTGLYLLGKASTQANTLLATLQRAAAQMAADKRFRHDLGDALAQLHKLAEAIQDIAAHAEMAIDETPTA